MLTLPLPVSKCSLEDIGGGILFGRAVGLKTMAYISNLFSASNLFCTFTSTGDWARRSYKRTDGLSYLVVYRFLICPNEFENMALPNSHLMRQTMIMLGESLNFAMSSFAPNVKALAACQGSGGR